MLAEPSVFALRPAIREAGVPAAEPYVIVRGSRGIDLATLLDSSTAAGTNFGAAIVGGASTTQSFTIENAGNATLWISGVGIEGMDADQFSIGAPPDPLALAGFSTTFSVRFHARREGPAFALVLLSTNDPEEHPYMFLVEGLGLPR